MSVHDKEQIATLALARHLLLARAVELHQRFEAMSALHSAPFDRIRPSCDDESTVRRQFDELDADMRMVAPLMVYLEQRMRAASRQRA